MKVFDFSKLSAYVLIVSAVYLFVPKQLSAAETSNGDTDSFDNIFTSYKAEMEKLAAGCNVIRDIQQVRSQLNGISTKTETSASVARLCITKAPPSQWVRSTGNLAISYALGEIPVIGSILVEISQIIGNSALDSAAEKCYALEEGKKIFSSLIDEIAKIEEPYQSARQEVANIWWTSAMGYQDKLESMAGGSQDKRAKIQELEVNRRNCPAF